MKRLGILGLGKMGSSILNGIISSKLYKKEDVLLYMPRKEKQQEYLENGYDVASSEEELFFESKIILLAIKPQVFNKIYEKAQTQSFKDKCVISIAAGIKIQEISNNFKDALVVRAMPNTPAQIKFGATAVCTNDKTNPLFKEALYIFKSIGIAEIIDEEQMNAIIPINGSMPAFLYSFAKEFINIGIEKGIDEEVCTRLCAVAIIGSAKMILESNEPITQLIENVCSKKGTTIEGLESLYENGFRKAIRECFEATVARANELSK